MIGSFIEEFLEENDLIENNSEEICEDCEESLEEAMQELDEIMQEGVSASTIRVTRKDKLNMASGAASLRIAKMNQDPLYKQYKKLRAMALKVKAKLKTKYGSKGRRAARKAMA